MIRAQFVRRNERTGGKVRTCLDCCWIYRGPHLPCPQCGGPSTSAHWMYYKAAYEFAKSQYPFIKHMMEQAWEKDYDAA